RPCRMQRFDCRVDQIEAERVRSKRGQRHQELAPAAARIEYALAIDDAERLRDERERLSLQPLTALRIRRIIEPRRSGAIGSEPDPRVSLAPERFDALALAHQRLNSISRPSGPI